MRVLILKVIFLLAITLTKQVLNFMVHRQISLSLFFKRRISLDCWSYCEASNKEQGGRRRGKMFSSRPVPCRCHFRKQILYLVIVAQEQRGGCFDWGLFCLFEEPINCKRSVLAIARDLRMTKLAYKSGIISLRSVSCSTRLSNCSCRMKIMQLSSQRDSK